MLGRVEEKLEAIKGKEVKEGKSTSLKEYIKHRDGQQSTFNKESSTYHHDMYKAADHGSRSGSR